MPVTILVPRFRRNPNAKVDSLYYGVSPNGGMGMVTRVIKPSADQNHMEVTQTAGGPGLRRGESGLAGILVLGGMETTLDEMEYILTARREKKFVPRRGPGEIAQMCRLVAEKRNDQILAQRIALRKNPSERLPKKPRVRLHLPVGVRYAQTNVPGLRVLASI